MSNKNWGIKWNLTPSFVVWTTGNKYFDNWFSNRSASPNMSIRTRWLFLRIHGLPWHFLPDKLAVKRGAYCIKSEGKYMERAIKQHRTRDNHFLTKAKAKCKAPSHKSSIHAALIGRNDHLFIPPRARVKQSAIDCRSALTTLKYTRGKWEKQREKSRGGKIER